MSNTTQDAPLSPSQVQALLPFYVNGTLADQQRTQVEQTLQSTPALQAELEWHRSMRAAVQRQASTHARSDAGLSALTAMLAADRAGLGRRSSTDGLVASLLARFREWLSDVVPSPGLTVAYGLVAVQCAVIVYLVQRPAQDEHAQLRSAADVAGAPFFRVLLRPQTTESELSALLRQLELRIVGGPNQFGEYWLAGVDSTKSTDRAATVAALERSGMVQTVVVDDVLPHSRH